MPRTHRPSPPEFRAEAVRLARSSDKSIPTLAADWASHPRRCGSGCGKRMPTRAGGSWAR